MGKWVSERVDPRQTTGIVAAGQLQRGFVNSPDLTIEILTAFWKVWMHQTELSTRALNSVEIHEGLKPILLDHLGLYEKPRSRAAGN